TRGQGMDSGKAEDSGTHAAKAGCVGGLASVQVHIGKEGRGNDMSSKKRLVVPNYAHFVIMQGHNGEPIFRDAPDYQQFLSLMRRLKQELPIEVHGWCLERNAVRLLLLPHTAEALGTFIQ